MRKTNRITGIEGVAQGALCTFSLPVGPRYHGIKIYTRLNGSLSDPTGIVDRVRLKVNEVTVWDVTAAFLIAEAKLNRITPTTGELPLYFSEPGRADKTDEQVLAWDTFGERSFKVELQLKSTGTPADTFLISGTRIFDEGGTFVKDAAGNLIRTKNIVRKVSIGYNAPAGQYDLDTLPIRNPISAIHLDGAANITYVEVNADSERVWEMANTENAAVGNDYGLDYSQFKYPLRFDFTEQVSDFLAVAKTLNVRVTSAAAQTLTAHVVSIGNSFNA